MCSSIATLRSHGCASSASAISGNSRSEPPISRRCGRPACHKRAASLRSNAAPSRSAVSVSWRASGTRDLLLELLDAPQARVEAARPHEVVVAALLHHPPGVGDRAAGARLRGAQPVRREQPGPPAYGAAEVPDDLL